LNVRIGRRDIGFRLVVIIITDKKLDMVFRKEALELCIQLCRERLIVDMINTGLLIWLMTFEIVKVFPLPVTPRRVWNFRRDAALQLIGVLLQAGRLQACIQK